MANVSITKPVRKAVIAAAGFGTRFLPQTKAMPKEMLPIVDKPIIQYVVEELVDAGIEDIIIVTGYSKRSIEDHFDNPSQDLIANLEMGGESKAAQLKEVKSIANLANFIYLRQKGRYGNGTPILNAEHLIGDEPFIFTFGDDFVHAKPSRFSQLIEAYKKYETTVLGCILASEDNDYDKYGFAAGDELGGGLVDTKQIIEKPGKEDAPGNLATVSGYLLTPDVFSYLKQASGLLKENQELYYNDAFKLMLKDGKRIIACEVQNAKYYDSGDKLEYLKTVVDFALMRDDIKDDFAGFLHARISES